MGNRLSAKRITVARAAVLLAILLFSGACSGETGENTGEDAGPSTGAQRGTTGATNPTTTTDQGTTREEQPPEITLGESTGDRPVAVLRVEGGRRTTFSGLCSVGVRENVLSGRVPKRFTFDLRAGAELSCRIEKQDQGNGALKVILVTGDTTRSVQQTNSPGATLNVSYRGG